MGVKDFRQHIADISEHANIADACYAELRYIDNNDYDKYKEDSWIYADGIKFGGQIKLEHTKNNLVKLNKRNVDEPTAYAIVIEARFSSEIKVIKDGKYKSINNDVHNFINTEDGKKRLCIAVSEELDEDKSLPKHYLSQRTKDFTSRYQIMHHVYTGNGFSATLFKDTKEKRYIFANRGTDDSKDKLDADFKLVLDLVPESQYADMIDFYAYCAEKYNIDNEPINITGHSLGGALTQLLVMTLCSKDTKYFNEAYTFNSPGVKNLNTLLLKKRLYKISLVDEMEPSCYQNQHGIYNITIPFVYSKESYINYVACTINEIFYKDTLDDLDTSYMIYGDYIEKDFKNGLSKSFDDIKSNNYKLTLYVFGNKTIYTNANNNKHEKIFIKCIERFINNTTSATKLDEILKSHQDNIHHINTYGNNEIQTKEYNFLNFIQNLGLDITDNIYMINHTVDNFKESHKITHAFNILAFYDYLLSLDDNYNNINQYTKETIDINYNLHKPYFSNTKYMDENLPEYIKKTLFCFDVFDWFLKNLKLSMDKFIKSKKIQIYSNDIYSKNFFYLFVAYFYIGIFCKLPKQTLNNKKYLINESNIYDLIFKLKNKECFIKIITPDVLKQIQAKCITENQSIEKHILYTKQIFLPSDEKLTTTIFYNKYELDIINRFWDKSFIDAMYNQYKSIYFNTDTYNNYIFNMDDT